MTKHVTPRQTSPISLDECQRVVEGLMHASGWHVKSLEDQGLGFAEESGEVCQALRKIVRYGATPERVEHLGEELADTLTYLCWLSSMHGINLADAFEKKTQHIQNVIIKQAS